MAAHVDNLNDNNPGRVHADSAVAGGRAEDTGFSTPLGNPAHDGAATLTDQEWKTLGRLMRLSPRELQIVEAVCLELKDRAIAERLGISTHTVRTHFERLFRKLGVHSRGGVAVNAMKFVHRVRDRSRADQTR